MENKFYRYEIRNYVSINEFGDIIKQNVPNPRVILMEYNLFKETLKGYWIGHGINIPEKLKSNAHWVSKSAKKRFAYPTKQEALLNFIKRTERRIKILDWESWMCKIAIENAKCIKIEE